MTTHLTCTMTPALLVAAILCGGCTSSPEGACRGLAFNHAIANAYEVYDLEIWPLAIPFNRLREVSRHNMPLAKQEADMGRPMYEAMRRVTIL